MKQTIVWLVDVPGWAYSNRAINLSQNLPGYIHRIVCYPRLGFDDCKNADIIVCPDPRIMDEIPDGPSIVLNVNAIKIFRN